MMIKNGGATVSPHVNGTNTTRIGDDDTHTHTEPTKTTPKGKLQRLLSGISNRSCSFSTTVKKVFVGLGDVFKAITTKWGRDAATPARMPMQKASADEAKAQHHTLLLALVSGESANTVTPKNILSPLLNDGKSVPSDRNNDSDDKKMIFDYLLKNPTSHLFSSDNIRCQGDYIYFNKPISLVRQGDDLLFITNPMEVRAISKVKIDTRMGTNGEFRSETAMKVLQDKTLTFTTLTDLCQKMTANPQRNISPGPEHVSAMTKRFKAQSSITDNASVQHDAPNRKRVISAAIQALQDKLAAKGDLNKPLGGGIRQR